LSSCPFISFFHNLFWVDLKFVVYGGTFYLVWALWFKVSRFQGLLGSYQFSWTFFSWFKVYHGTFDLFLAFWFRGSNYPGLITSSMEPFEFILSLSNGTFDLNTCTLV
jgi:hypothetical protein